MTTLYQNIFKSLQNCTLSCGNESSSVTIENSYTTLYMHANSPMLKDRRTGQGIYNKL